MTMLREKEQLLVDQKKTETWSEWAEKYCWQQLMMRRRALGLVPFLLQQLLLLLQPLWEEKGEEAAVVGDDVEKP